MKPLLCCMLLSSVSQQLLAQRHFFSAQIAPWLSCSGACSGSSICPHGVSCDTCFSFAGMSASEFHLALPLSLHFPLSLDIRCPWLKHAVFPGSLLVYGCLISDGSRRILYSCFCCVIPRTHIPPVSALLCPWLQTELVCHSVCKSS